MAVCTFFGHRQCPAEIEADLNRAIRKLITEYGVLQFYVGHHGGFDGMAYRTLKALKQEFPRLDYAVVLAYMPGKQDRALPYAPEETLYPDGLETAPLRFAIDHRNRWMLKHSDYVISYITHGHGGAAQYYELAHRWKKTVFNLAKPRPWA